MTQNSISRLNTLLATEPAGRLPAGIESRAKDLLSKGWGGLEGSSEKQ